VRGAVVEVGVERTSKYTLVRGRLEIFRLAKGLPSYRHAITSAHYAQLNGILTGTASVAILLSMLSRNTGTSKVQ